MYHEAQPLGLLLVLGGTFLTDSHLQKQVVCFLRLQATREELSRRRDAWKRVGMRGGVCVD